MRRYPVIYTETDYVGSDNLKRAEKRLIIRASARFYGSRTKMAEALGIPTSSLRDKILAHGLVGLV